MIWPFRKRDWRRTGDTRWRTIKRAGGFVLQHHEEEFLDMNSGERAWRPTYWGTMPDQRLVPEDAV